MIFTARCYAERGNATVSRLSVCVWRWGMIFTQVGMGRLKRREWKTQDWNTWDQSAGVENAGVKKTGPKCRGGKRRTRKCRTKFAGVELAGLENTGTWFVCVARRNVINVVPAFSTPVFFMVPRFPFPPFQRLRWNTSKTMSRPNSVRLLLGLTTTTGAIWCNRNTPTLGWNRGRVTQEHKKTCNISEMVQDRTKVTVTD